jgi:hypothetical protein
MVILQKLKNIQVAVYIQNFFFSKKLIHMKEKNQPGESESIVALQPGLGLAGSRVVISRAEKAVILKTFGPPS